MKPFISRFLFIFSLILPTAQAGEHFWFADLGVQWKNDNTYDPDLIQSLGLTYGYGLNTNWAIEIDYLQSIGGGSYERDVSNLIGFEGNETESGELTLWSSAISINFRQIMAESLYFKGRLGYNYSEEERTSSVAGKGSFNDEHSYVISIGGGFLAGELVGSSTTFELEYSFFGNKYSGLMFGANLTF